MDKPWTLKYAPKRSDDLIGQENPLIQLKRFVLEYKKQKKRGMVIYGSSGCGKTSSVHALADDLGLEIVEINASDSRNKDAIESIVGGATRQMSLFGTGKIILIDEIDGLAGNKDRGGVQALVRILKYSVFPVIMTCDDPYDKKYSALRKEIDIVQFMPLKYSEISGALIDICKKEGIDFDESAVKQLARQSDGDLRAATNDLQTIAGKSKRLNMADLDMLGERIKKEKIEEALLRVFKMKDPSIVQEAFYNVQEDINAQMMWIDENLPKEYKDPASLARAYDYLSRADVFLGRIRRRQHWRFLATAGPLMSAGVAVSKDERNPAEIKYSRPDRILEMWKAKMMNQKRDSISTKIADGCHVSVRRARQDILPYVRAMCKKNKSVSDSIMAALELSTDESQWLSR